MSRKSLENTSSSIGLALCAWLLVGVLFGTLQRLPLLAGHTALLLFTLYLSTARVISGAADSAAIKVMAP